MYKALAFGLVLAACGSGGNGNTGDDDDGSNTPPADARVFLDAPPSVPAMITISGTANDNGQSTSTPLAGVTVSLLSVADDSMIATATSGADGTYSMAVTTNGHVVDAYVLATKSGYTDAASFPPAPFAVDEPKADSNLVTTGNFNLLGFYTGQMAGKGIVVTEILDASSAAVTGATVASTPAATYRYSDSNGTPSSTTSTNSDGAAFLINVAPGMVSVSATKSGSVFKTHSIKVRANTFTSTVVRE
jgi:hypothetical protein